MKKQQNKALAFKGLIKTKSNRSKQNQLELATQNHAMNEVQVKVLKLNCKLYTVPLTCSVYLVIKLVSNAYTIPIIVPPIETTKNDAKARPT